jgi:hypothetical protein
MAWPQEARREGQPSALMAWVRARVGLDPLRSVVMLWSWGPISQGQSLQVLADEQAVATLDQNLLVCTVTVPKLCRARQARCGAVELFVKWDGSQ